MPVSHLPTRAALLAATLVLAVAPVSAQVPGNCSLGPLPDPARHVLQCAGGLSIEISTGAVLGYDDRGTGLPQRLSVRQGTVLIEVTPGGFAPQIRTPQAIAAVRGTVYAVEVQADNTAVFVVRGRVDVRALGGVSGVSLGAGQGVDVRAGAPLEVKTWGEARVRALLSRFGR